MPDSPEEGENVARRPHTAGVVVPPLVSLIGLAVAMWMIRYLSLRERSQHKVHPKSQSASKQGVDFFHHDDRKILYQFQLFQNNPIALLRIGLPSCISLVLCPLALLLHDEIMACFWPTTSGDLPKINDGISCFLTPAGLVYAIAFGFAFQEAIRKQTDLNSRIVGLVNKMDQIMVMCSQIPSMTSALRARVRFILKSVTIDWMSLLMGAPAASRVDDSNGNLRITEPIWSLIDIAKDMEREHGTSMQSATISQLVEHVFELHRLSTDRFGQLKSSMKLIQWVFLEILALISFFGVLLLKADSPSLELTMCITTVLSVSMFSYLLADLDQPYHGVFKVDLHGLIAFLEKLERSRANDECSATCINASGEIRKY